MNLSTLTSASKVLIYGYGVEGKSSLNFLKSQFPDKQMDIYDQKHEEYSAEKNLQDYDVIIVSPGIPREQLSEVDASKLTSGTEVFFSNIEEACRQKMIGITGSKGKSTSVKLCKEIIENAGHKVEIGGNFGVPLLDVFERCNKGDLDYLVLELSSYQLENLKISPHFSLFLNFFPDHLDRHGDVESYFAAKRNLWAHQRAGDHVIVLQKYAHLDLCCNEESIETLANPLPKEFFPENSPFRAEHYLENFGCVYELAKILNISDEVIKKTCANFEGLEHRMEAFAYKNGILFVNDANATTPEAALAACNYFAPELGSQIVGGQNRGYDFSQLIDKMVSLNIHIIILESESGQIIQELLEQKGYSKYSVACDIPEIVAQAFEHTPKEKTCLLSMGSPSYGAFSGFAEKGRMFKEMVMNY